MALNWMWIDRKALAEATTLTLIYLQGLNDVTAGTQSMANCLANKLTNDAILKKLICDT